MTPIPGTAEPSPDGATQPAPALGYITPHRERYFFVINRKSGNYFKWFVQLGVGEFLTTEGVTGEVHYLKDTVRFTPVSTKPGPKDSGGLSWSAVTVRCRSQPRHCAEKTASWASCL